MSNGELEAMQRRAERERSARKEAERVLEEKSRELYQANQQLRALNENLEKIVEERSGRLKEAYVYQTAIIDNIADGLLVTDPHGMITQANPALTALFTFDNRKGQNSFCRNISPALDRLAHECQQARCAVAAEVDLARGRTGKAVANAIVSEGECLGAVIIVRDITAEKEIDQMKTDFISTVSHELRTPLTSVVGFAKIIKKKLQESVFPLVATDDKKVMKGIEKVSQNIDIIVSEGVRLTALINDVLDVAKMESGRTEWNMERLSVKDVIERAVSATAALFESRPGVPVKLIKEIPEDLPAITADRDRLIQVVINLISNAAKFTDQGAVTCRAEYAGSEIVVKVEDSGMGIAEGDLEKVFEKFKQVGDTLTNKPKGTGLGLPICKQIIEHHHGRIWAESRLGQGSTFMFTLPVALADPRTQNEKTARVDIDSLIRHLERGTVAGAANGMRKRVLVVDDEAHIRDLLRQELEEAGYAVIEARDGMEAITLARQERPDLITLDVMMPQINGYDVAAMLKNNPATMSIPIIIVSIVEDKERGYKVGIDRYLTKPINVEVLLGEVETLIEQGSSAKKVLIVDENKPTARVLVDLLQARGYQVAEVASGAESVEAAMRHRPDMVIVDALLSKRHGIINTLRFEKGMENVLFLLMGEGDNELAAEARRR